MSSCAYRYEDEQGHRIRSQAWVLVVLPVTAGLHGGCRACGGGASAAPEDWSAALRALLAGLALAAAFFLLLIASPGAGLGLGDVKLAIGPRMLLGWFSWAIVLVGAFLGFLTASVWGLSLVVTRRATRKWAIPFGPLLVLGAWLAVLVA